MTYKPQSPLTRSHTSLRKPSLLTDDSIDSSHDYLHPYLPNSLVLRNISAVLSIRRKAVGQPSIHKKSAISQDRDSKTSSINVSISASDSISPTIKEKALTMTKNSTLSTKLSTT